MAAFSYVLQVFVPGHETKQDRTYFPASTTIRNPIDEGKIEHGFVDQKGRAVGYRWRIESVINVPFADEVEYRAYKAARPYACPNVFATPDDMVYVEVTGFPTRDGNHYGSSGHNVRVATVEEARRLVIKRITQAEKRDFKKFVSSKREAA
jgi:hypothetical protein